MKDVFLNLGWSTEHFLLASGIGESLKGLETTGSTNLQTWANVGLGILLLVYGGASFLGMEVKQTAKKWIIGGFAGAIIIVNFSSIRDLIWSAIGG